MAIKPISVRSVLSRGCPRACRLLHPGAHAPGSLAVGTADGLYASRVYEPPAEPDYPFHDRTVCVTRCGRICVGKINLSTVFAGMDPLKVAERESPTYKPIVAPNRFT